jgi:replicative DNA helicase
VETSYGLSSEDRVLLLNSFKQISNSDVGDDVLRDSFRVIRERQVASELAIASLSVAEGRSDKQSLIELYSRLTEDQEPDHSDTSEFITDDLESLYKDTWATAGLRWRLDSLNKRLGSLRKGDFGFIFARPETGKTTFLSSEVSYMAAQLSEEAGPILWFNY